MRAIITTIVVFVSSVMLVSADEVAKSHEEVGKQTAAVMASLMGDMSKITDEESAKAFAATLPAAKEKLQVLLKAAQALPAPTEEEKATVNKAIKASEEEGQPALMAMMKSLPENPDAEAIGVILDQFMSDEEMEEIISAFEDIYVWDEQELDEQELDPAPDTE